jgi:hypothetical protein
VGEAGGEARIVVADGRRVVEEREGAARLADRGRDRGADPG